MAIVNCKECGYELLVTVENEGRVMRCPQCESRLFVPLSQTATAANVNTPPPSPAAVKPRTKKIVWSPKTRFSLSANSADSPAPASPLTNDYAAPRQQTAPAVAPSDYLSLPPQTQAPIPSNYPNYSRSQPTAPSNSASSNYLPPRQPIPTRASRQSAPAEPAPISGQYSPEVEKRMKELSPLGILAEANALVVRQRVEHTEVWLGIEGKNSYDIYDQSGRKCYEAREYELSWLSAILRIALKSARPFTMSVSKLLGGQALEFKRPFRFFFYKLEVYGPDKRLYGSIERQFAFLRRRFLLQDHSGRPILEIIGPFFHPWTFNVYRNGKEVARITKKWSGLLKEAFSSADNFNLQFLQKDLAVELRALLLGALILIDFVHFEYKG